MSYKQAGVDIERGDALVGKIRRLARSTRRTGVLGEIGGFGGFFRIDSARYRSPVLVSGTDGVGTKLDVAGRVGRHDTVGVDLVAMCVNDIVVSGAEPLFFLDYIATGKLKTAVALELLRGIAKGCREAGCALLGGETAEMPSFYSDGKYDLAGFAVGIVEKSRLIDGRGIRAGDLLVGLPSSGMHSNGFSLARKVVFEKARLSPRARPSGWKKSVGEELLTPTRIYVKPVLASLRRVPIKGLAHVTGGGITGNLPRILPGGLGAIVRKGSWTVPPVFEFIQKEGRISDTEMFRVFNMGIGMVMVLSPRDLSRFDRMFSSMNERYHLIGEVVAKKAGGVVYGR